PIHLLLCCTLENCTMLSQSMYILFAGTMHSRMLQAQAGHSQILEVVNYQPLTLTTLYLVAFSP
ncbi:MAG: hypothetical protein ACPL7O_12090, partial [Armatimonadota bacterium]